MNATRSKRALFYAAGLIVVAALGIWLGTSLGLRRAGGEQEQARIQKFLKDNIIDIEVGKMFPDFPLWSADHTQAFSVHELLPHGGVLVYIASGCEGCYAALQGLKDAQAAVGEKGKSVLVVLDGDPDSLKAGLQQSGLDMPFYHDAERYLAVQYQVRIFPTSFVLSDGGTLAEMVAATYTRDEFEKIIRR